MNDTRHLPTKNRILQALQKNGEWCSGQEIADILGVSRAAVGKHVAALREEGHVIESAPKRGYRLAVLADALCEEEIMTGLTTRQLGRGVWHILGTTVSTGNELVGLALQGAPEGTMVVAEAQSRGRGRKEHDWFSAPRSVQFSLLLRPASEGLDLELLMRGAVLAVAQALRTLQGVDAKVKTPNDVFIGNKKVAGVLIESGFRGGALDWVTIGVGCNVNTLADEFPKKLRPAVTSLYQESQGWTSRNALIAIVLNFFEYWYETVCRGETDELEKTWKELHVTGINKQEDSSG